LQFGKFQSYFAEKLFEMTKTKSFILSDESINSYGFRVLTSGADLEQFCKNPVMFYNHNEWGTPIGRWENIRVTDGKILADPVFDTEDEDAAKIAGKVERGFLRAASIGLRIIERSEDARLMLPGQTRPTVTRWKMRECSIVNIGANDGALVRLYDENDRLLTDDEVVKLFDASTTLSSHKQNPINLDRKMKKETFTLLDLAENADDNQLHDAIKRLVESNKQLTDKLQGLETAATQAKKAEAVQLTDAAIREGRLNAPAREQTLKLFDNNFDATKTMLEAIPERKSLKDAVGEADKTELEKLSAKSWDELDKSGGLQTLKDKYPDTFKEKYREKFGAEAKI
jgi:phage head maturation protease